MSEKKSLEESILEELQKTGYPTEIFCASVMEQRGWGVIHNPSYWDEEESQSREFDIRAYKQWLNDTQDLKVGVYLITECKKSEKPWVFFTTAENYHFIRLGQSIKVRSVNRQIFTDFEHQKCIISDDELKTFHHYFQNPNQARTFHEPLKQQEKASHSQMIYTAVMATVKATLFHCKEPPLEKWLDIYYPVIIFNGNLFEAFINPDKSINLTSTSHVQLVFNYIQHEPSTHSSIWSAREKLTVDVVHENYLDRFLKIVEDEHKIIASKI